VLLVFISIVNMKLYIHWFAVCGNQHHSRELLMMGIVMPETCSAYKKYNKIISGIYLVFYSSVITMMHGPINIRYTHIHIREAKPVELAS